jgi:glycosyltransferase involved in cell wall biosynthesis
MVELITTENINTKSLVSIIVITYNSAKYVVETLESAKSQTYKNIELIITDDASQDDTVEICKNWLDGNKERFIRTELVTIKNNTCISANCNRGVCHSNGEWVKLIAGDDILLPNCISINIDYIKENNEALIVASYMKHFFLEKEKYIIKEFSKAYIKKLKKFFDKSNSGNDQFNILVAGNHISFTPTLFIKNSFLNKMNLFNEEYFIEDQPFLFEITKNNYKIEFIEKYTVLYRISNPESVSSGITQGNERFNRDIKKIYFQHVKQNANLITRYEWNLLFLRYSLKKRIKKPLLFKFLNRLSKLISPRYIKQIIYNIIS